MGKMRHRIHFGTIPQSNLFDTVTPGGGGEISRTYQCGQRRGVTHKKNAVQTPY